MAGNGWKVWYAVIQKEVPYKQYVNSSFVYPQWRSAPGSAILTYAFCAYLGAMNILCSLFFNVFGVRQKVSHCRQMVSQKIISMCGNGMQRSVNVKAQGCASALECPPHIVVIGAPFPGSLRCAIQLTGALVIQVKFQCMDRYWAWAPSYQRWQYDAIKVKSCGTSIIPIFTLSHDIPT